MLSDPTDPERLSVGAIKAIHNRGPCDFAFHAARYGSGTSPLDRMLSYIRSANSKDATHSLGEMTGSWGGPKLDLTFSIAVSVIAVPFDTQHYNRPQALSQTIGP